MFVKKIKENKFLLFCFVFTLIFGLLICASKTTFNVDESLSFALANVPGGWIAYENPHGWFDKAFFTYGARIDHLFDYSGVYWNQYFDVHPPLYYLILHTISSIFPGRFTIHFGLIINLFSYILNCLLIYYFVHKIVNNKLISLLTAIIYATNTFVIDSLSFIRMYQLESFFVLVLFISSYNVVFDNKNGIYNYLMLFLSILLGGLTHYYFYIILFLLCVVFAIVLIVRKQYKKLILSMLIVFLTSLLNFCLFPPIFHHLFESGHGNHLIGTISNGLINLGAFFDYLSISFGYASIFIVILIVITLPLFCKRKNIFGVLATVIICVCILYVFIISQISKHTAARYVYVIYPLIIISITIVLCLIIKNKKKLKQIVVILLVLNSLITVEKGFIRNGLLRTKSWEYAEKNQYGVALVIVEEDTYDYEINTAFADFRWYYAIGMTNIHEPLDNNIDANFVLYKEKTVSEFEMKEYCENIIDKELKFEHQENIQTNLFDVYYVEVK